MPIIMGFLTFTLESLKLQVHFNPHLWPFRTVIV